MQPFSSEVDPKQTTEMPPLIWSDQLFCRRAATAGSVTYRRSKPKPHLLIDLLQTEQIKVIRGAADHIGGTPECTSRDKAPHACQAR